ncbi:MAG: SMC family ATPase [bacterium]|nr:SMC family ATPase [bacterium]
MRLIELEINNFRVLKQAKIEFPESVIGIIGRNGAGKTSIIEAISWAIYGNQAARTGKDQIKSSFAGPGEECRVSLKFKVRGEEYQVIRRLIGKSDRAEVELYRGGRSESVGIIDTKDHVGELLGLDLKGFLTSFMARQQELNALADLQPARRKDHLAMMLGVEKLDKAISTAKEDARQFGKDSEFLERQLAEKSSVETALAELKQSLVTVQEEFEVSETALKESMAVKDKTAGLFKAEQEKKSSYDLVQVELGSTKSRLETVQGELSKRKQELVDLQKQAELLEPITEELKGLEGCRERFDHQNELRLKAESVESSMRLLKSQKEDLAQLEAQIAVLRKEEIAARAEIAAIPANIDEQIGLAEKELGEARDNYGLARGTSEANRKEIEKLRNQLNSVEKLGPGSICDRCQRPFGDEYSSIKAHLEAEVAELAEKQRELDKSLAVILSGGEKLKQSVQELQRQGKRKAELDLGLKGTVRGIEEAETGCRKLKDSIGPLEEAVKKESKIPFDPAILEKARKELDRQSSLQRELSRVQGMLSQRGKIEESIAALARQMGELTRLRQETELKLKELDWNPDAYTVAASEFERGMAEFEQAREKHTILSSRIGGLQAELQGKKERLADFERASQELDRSRDQGYHIEKLASLMTEYRTITISQIRPTLADLASQLVSEMTGGKYSMVDLDEKYNLRLLDYGEYFEVNRFSGGEKDLASLCLRLAISQMLTRAAGLDQSFILLDEVFGSQDNERRDLIIDSLGNLRASFPQIVLITHIDELKHRVETLIEVETTENGWSQVKCNGQIS